MATNAESEKEEMSVVSVFSFLFESEGADKVKSELQNLERTQDSAANSADKLSDSQKELKDNFQNNIRAVTSMIASYVGFKKVLSEISNFASGGEQLYLMAQNAGVGAEMLERYGIALQNYGGGLSSAASTLSHLGSMLQDIKFGGGGAIKDAALRYGISVSGKNGIATAEEFLENIARRMERLNTQQQLDLGRKLGLDPATMSLVMGGVENLNAELKKAQEFTLYSKEDLENSRRYQAALRDLTASINKIWGVVARALLPVVTAVTEAIGSFFNYISKHKGFVLGFFATLAAVLGVMAASALAASWPIIAIIAAIVGIGTAIGLVIDDLMTFAEGGESVTGMVADAFASLFLKIFEWGDKIKEFFGNVWDSIVDGIAGAFLTLFEWWDKIKQYIPFLNGKGVVDTGLDILGDTASSLSTAVTNMFNEGNNNSVKIDNVTVNTQATNATGIAAGLGSALNSEFEDVLYQNTGGVAI